MPHWEGIEDASVSAKSVWLSRVKDTDDWKPLRKCDCQALNQARETGKSQIYIEMGRAAAYLNQNDKNPDDETPVIRYNFFRGRERKLCHAIWFLREEKSSKEIVLKPITKQSDSDAIESFYQQVIEASSSLGAGIKSMLATEVALSDGPEGTKRFVSVVSPTKNSCKLILSNKGWFKGSVDLQRGYGEYAVAGEEEEMQLGPVRHVAFVIHGIGESLFSREEVNLPSLVDIMNATREEIQRKQITDWKEACKKAEKAKEAKPAPPYRIELIPIEWFDEIHNSSSSLMKSLRAVSLPTIPALRMIANDVVFDVLMYLTPAFNSAVLECVTRQIHNSYDTFMKIHGEEFGANAGRCILIGHSLGSVICWDLLSVLKEKTGDAPGRASTTFTPAVSQSSSTSSPVPPWTSSSGASRPETPEPTGIMCCGDVGYMAYAKEENANVASNGTWGPSLIKPMEKVLPFIPECTFFLGSPCGIFLTLRGAHACFDQLRFDAQKRMQRHVDAEKKSVTDPNSWLGDTVPVPVVSPFTLPTDRFYNIFHPNDPVAYRIEPLLLSQDLDPTSVPQPAYLTPPGRNVRLSTKAKLIGDEIRKTFAEQKNAWNALLDSTLNVLGQEKDAAAQSKTELEKASAAGGSLTAFPLNNGNRVS